MEKRVRYSELRASIRLQLACVLRLCDEPTWHPPCDSPHLTVSALRSGDTTDIPLRIKESSDRPIPKMSDTRRYLIVPSWLSLARETLSTKFRRIDISLLTSHLTQHKEREIEIDRQRERERERERACLIPASRFSRNMISGNGNEVQTHLFINSPLALNAPVDLADVGYISYRLIAETTCDAFGSLSNSFLRGSAASIIAESTGLLSHEIQFHRIWRISRGSRVHVIGMHEFDIKFQMLQIIKERRNDYSFASEASISINMDNRRLKFLD